MTLFPLLALAACGTPGAPAADPWHEAESPAPEGWATPELVATLAGFPTAVYGIPNLDDDDEDGVTDWSDSSITGDDDLAAYAIPAALGSSPTRIAVKWVLSGDVDEVRLLLSGSTVLGYSSGGTTTEWAPTKTVLAAGPVLDVEFKDYLSDVTLTAQILNAGTVVKEISTRLLASPLVVNHHLQPAEMTWVMDVDLGFWGDNADMLAEFSSTLGAMFTPVDDRSYGYDVWVQDEIEFANTTAPGLRGEVVIDSVRDRGLDDWPEDELERPGRWAQTWGTSRATSQDSFGNLEVTPPLDVAGVDYPLGRVYWGENGSLDPAEQLTDFLTDQLVQEPFHVDSTWLCVGHVDEWMSFVPDATAPRGFRLFYADVDLGYDTLNKLSGSTSLPQYSADHGYSTISALRSDVSLKNYNEDLRDDYLLPILDQLTLELDLTSDEIVLVPQVFEEVGGCGGAAVALIPGMVNLIVTQDEAGDSHLFMADPFLRSNTSMPSTDPLIAWWDAVVPAEHTTHYVDDWDVYHMGLGEVHCGTNVQRTPTTDWWTDAAHLLP